MDDIWLVQDLENMDLMWRWKDNFYLDQTLFKYDYDKGFPPPVGNLLARSGSSWRRRFLLAKVSKWTVMTDKFDIVSWCSFQEIHSRIFLKSFLFYIRVQLPLTFHFKTFS